MREAITLAFEVVWLAALAVAVGVGLMTRAAAGRRRLRRWIKPPTLIWWETERPMGPGADAGAVLSELRSAVPGIGDVDVPARLCGAFG